jgi:hypothetical protein
MKYEDALKLYLDKHDDSYRIINNIVNWDNDKNITDNSKSMGISPCGAYRFMLKYGLKSKICKLGRKRTLDISK